jgi:Zn-dependent metalloprotease
MFEFEKCTCAEYACDQDKWVYLTVITSSCLKFFIKNLNSYFMKIKILLLLFLSFVIATAYSQNFINKEIRGERGISKQFISVEDDQPVNFNVAQVKSLLNLNDNSELVLQKTEQDKLGFIHYRYYQTYRSIPVENTMFIVHTKNGMLKSLGGTIVIDFDPTIDQRTAQRLSGEQAISLAVQYVHAKLYAWQDAEMEKSIKTLTKNSGASYKPSASLVWYSSTDGIDPRKLRLCFRVNVYAKKPLSSAYYYVDALTGTVLGKKDLIFYSDATGTANTAYSGAQTIHSDLSGGSYHLRDNTKGGGVITLHGESGLRGNDYSSAAANWTLSGIDIAALDAHYGISQTYAFYSSIFGRNSYDNAGSALISYVNDPTYLDNAFWDFTTHTMNFNERSDGNPGGVTAIDVTGHELTHGVTQASSGLNYSYESGAINESMSDIMGKSVQFWSKPADIDWRLSNDMNWVIRDMSNPNAGSPAQPDTYLGTNWYVGSGDNGGVHNNSGVGNFMFYLLVTGGSGTNDNGDAYSVTGIGLTEADAIIYRTNTVYLVPTSQYADWRTACVNSATDLYGGSSNEVAQVENAWHAVGVGAAAGECSRPTGLAASSISGTSATVSWINGAGAIKYSLRYKASTVSTWTSVNNIASNSYNVTGLTVNTTYNYKVQSVCPGNVRSPFTAIKSFTTAGGTYCSTFGNTGYEYINTVKLGTLNNTSGPNGGYGDYTALTVNFVGGSSKKIILTPGFYVGDSSAPYDEYWQVYIDYNHDGDFTDAGEKVAQGHGTGTITKSFVVPLTAMNGTTRMRVFMHFSSYLNDPCYPAGGFDGEVEDYSVKITGATFNGIAEENTARENTLNSIMVSPNPIQSSSANVVLDVGKAGAVNIKISDLSGRILRAETINGVLAGKNNYPLRNLNLLPGTYMIIAEQANAIIARTQFIIDG